MDVNIINAFLTAMLQMLDNLEAKGERGRVQGLIPPLPLGEVTTDTGVIGDLSGKFLISANHETALFLANRLGHRYGMPPSKTFGPMERSAFQEISNIVGGLASSVFANSDISVNIMPPKIIEEILVDLGNQSSVVVKIPIRIKAEERMEMNIFVSLA